MGQRQERRVENVLTSIPFSPQSLLPSSISSAKRVPCGIVILKVKPMCRPARPKTSRGAATFACMEIESEDECNSYPFTREDERCEWEPEERLLSCVDSFISLRCNFPECEGDDCDGDVDCLPGLLPTSVKGRTEQAIECRFCRSKCRRSR